MKFRLVGKDLLNNVTTDLSAECTDCPDTIEAMMDYVANDYVGLQWFVENGVLTAYTSQADRFTIEPVLA